MHDNDDNPAFRELIRVLEGAVQAGVNAIGLEYKGRELMVFHRVGAMGLGATRIAQELQQAVIEEIVKRAGLDRKSKGKVQVALLSNDYDVAVEEYDRFGESAFTLTLKQRRTKVAGPTLLALKKPTGEKADDAPKPPSGDRKVRIYTLVVFLPRTPINKTFAKKTSGVSRMIQIRGDQTLEDLHHAIFDAFDRDEEHMYEFQLGKGARDRQGPTYGMEDFGAENGGGLVTKTTIDSLRLKVGRSFGYLFDFGDHWQHQINVNAVEEVVPQGSFPRVTKRVGESPPQHPDEDE